METARYRYRCHARTFAILLLVLSGSVVHADWDAALEAREAAARQHDLAEQRRQEANRAAVKARNQSLIAADYRKVLGREAVGKSDAEVIALHNAKVQRETAASLEAVRRMKPVDPASEFKKGQALIDRKGKASSGSKEDQGAQLAGGLSFGDLMTKSPQELQKLADELERKAAKQ